MVLPSNLVQRPPSGQSTNPPRHRSKAWTLTLGATRSRLVQAMHHLGIYEGRIADRLRQEREEARLHEERRLDVLREEEQGARIHAARRHDELRSGRWAAQCLEVRRRTRLREEGRAAHLAEQRRFVLLLTEEVAFESMSEDQRASDRLEERIVSWLAADASWT